MIIYDYDDRPVEIELPNKPIAAIYVTVLSGDETGFVVFKDGQVVYFDASNFRNWVFYDGSYVVTEENVQTWMSFKPPKGRTASYERQSLFDVFVEDEHEAD